jgi:hypothetical protein
MIIALASYSHPRQAIREWVTKRKKRAVKNAAIIRLWPDMKAIAPTPPELEKVDLVRAIIFDGLNDFLAALDILNVY